MFEVTQEMKDRSSFNTDVSRHCDGLWYATLYCFWNGENVLEIVRGGYILQSSAKAQKTKMYNNRNSYLI